MKKTETISKGTAIKNTPRVKVLGVWIDKVSSGQALEKAEKLLIDSRRHYIVTPNPEILVAATKEAQFRNILNKADLAIPDGIGLVWLSKIFGINIPERVTGVDFLENLADLASKKGYSMFLLGAAEGIAEKAAKVLKNRYLNLKIVGTFSGDGSKRGDTETNKILKGKQIDILAVAYGPGKQERWIDRNLSKLDVKLAIGVGGALDFISGRRKRPPKFVQRFGLEWATRLVQEPRRIKRQLTIPLFVLLFVIERFKNKTI